MCVINFPRHKFVRHTHCVEPFCVICEGGLAICERCGGGEGSLPTDCPGYRIGYLREQLVYDGKLDFRYKEGWTNRPAKHWEHLG